MVIIKKFLLVVLVIVAGGAVLVWGSKYIPEGQLSGVKQAANQVQPFLEHQSQNLNVGQVSILTGQLTANVQSITGKVLGAQTSEPASASSSSDSSRPAAVSLPQRTFELARYSYCKEVVKEYDARNN